MKTLIIDGNNQAWRLQLKMPTLTADGEEVQALYGFMRLLRSVLTQFEPNVVLVCWDSGQSKHRLKLFKDYKGNRDRNSPDSQKKINAFKDQVHLIKDVLKKLNVAQMSYPDTEADDLIGIAAGGLSGEKIIVSSDRDMLHLVSNKISVWSPIKGTHYTHRNFAEMIKRDNKFEEGLTPQQWLEMRALTGDPGDNIPGVARGFGEVTASSLIQKYGSLEKLFTPSVEKAVSKMGNRYALLYSAEDSREVAYRNLMLMDLRLCINMEDGQKIWKLIERSVAGRQQIQKQAVRNYFIEKRFVSLLKDLPSWISPFEDLDT
jgi:DNA polymerase I